MTIEPHPTDPEKLVFRANKHFIPTGIEALVCQDVAMRQHLGISKYGTTVADNPLTHLEWLQHAYEECLDMAVYLRRAIDQHHKENT